MSEQTHEETRALLNAQTGKIEWPELQRHFARGVVICVAAGIDLVDVAAAIVEDNKKQIKAWMNDGTLENATEAMARDWHERQPVFWAVVAAPWVLIQEAE